MVVASFTNRSFEGGYRIGFPRPGRWTIRFNSDWKGYSPDFTDVGHRQDSIVAEEVPGDDLPFSGVMALPPYGFLILSQDADEIAKVDSEEISRA